MINNQIDNYEIVKECYYKNDKYSVRDNGAILRHSPPDNRKRKNDNVWTFGIENKTNLYLHLSSECVHRIVATAFHGEPPNPNYVVDHIDINCRNNRPENLRWLTKLENILLNPLTRKKIEYLCGSVDAFLDDTSVLNDKKVDPSLSWMRTVTKEEAINCKERLNMFLSNSDRAKKSSGKGFGEWLYQPISHREELHTILKSSLTELCVQKNWKVPSRFPCCPKELSLNPIEDYFQNLKIGEVFSSNEKYPDASIVEIAWSKDKDSILVLCEREGIKPWSIAKITYIDKKFIHSNEGSYFSKEGADKALCLGQGLNWKGGDVFDDFC